MIVDCPGCHLRYELTGRQPGTRARCRCGTSFAIPAEPKVAGTLQCPSCGAAADPAKKSCQYCTATLAVSACPSCFGMMFAGARCCPHCGVRADRPARPAESMETARRCPRCANGTTLVASLVGNTMLDRCEKCSGTFVDRESVEKLIADRDRQATLRTALSNTELTLPSAAVDAVKYLKCPECKTMMTRRNFGRVSGVIIDICPAHGTWFDAEELRRIIEFVQAGGLDKARKLEIENAERKVQEKKDHAEYVKVMSTSHLRRHTGSWGSDWSFEGELITGALSLAAALFFDAGD